MTDFEELLISTSSDGTAVRLDNARSVVNIGGAYDVVRDSHKVRSSAIADCRFSPQSGKTITVHKDGRLLAYVLELKDGGKAIRVLDWASKGRCLIKGLPAGNCDLAWSNTSEPPLLAAVDSAGCVHIYAIKSSGSQLQSSAFMSLLRDPLTENDASDAYYRCSWCPYVPDKDSDAPPPITQAHTMLGCTQPLDDIAHLIAVYKGDRVEMFMLDVIVEQYLALRQLDGDSEDGCLRVPISWLVDNCPQAYVLVSDHFKAFEEADAAAYNVTCVCISPDGTALALATDAGEIRFYVMEKMEEIKLAHAWKPHADAVNSAVDTIVFLDNVLSDTNCEQFWRYALTGANGNRELKLWNCEDWQCVSELSIRNTGALAAPAPALKLTTDLTGSYVLLSDLERCALYAIELGNRGDEMVFSAFNDFPLCYPVLDMSIVSVTKSIAAKSDDEAFESQQQQGNGASVGNPNEVHCALFAVNSRSVLRLEIRYDSSADARQNALSALPAAHDPARTLQGYIDHLTDLSTTLNTSAESFVSATVPVAATKPIKSDISSAAVPMATSRNGSASGTPALATAAAGATPTPPPPPPFATATQQSVARASPSSQEVYNILQHNQGAASAQPISDAVDGYDDDDEALPVEQQHRPQSPVMHTLDAEAGEDDDNDDDDEDNDDDDDLQGFVTEPDTASTELVNQRMQTIMNKLSKMSMEMERLVVHSERQSTEIEDLKDELRKSHAHTTHAVQDTLTACQLQRSATEDCAKQLASVQQQQQHTASALQPELIEKQVSECLGRIEQQLQTDVAAKLSATDNQLRDSINKTLKSKPLSENLAKAVADAFAGQLRASFKDSFERVAVPEFQTALGKLFDEINKVFLKGTKEYVSNLQSQQKALNASHSAWQQEQQTALTGALDAHMQRVHQALDTHVQRLSESLRTTITESTSNAIASNANMLNESVLLNQSRAQTPAPNARDEARRNVQHALAAGRVADALSMALNAQDLSLLVGVLSKQEPAALLHPTNGIPQLILLSMLQQLSTDLPSHTDVKLKWLSAVVLTIDPSDAGVAEHAPRIADAVYHSIGAFLASQPAGTGSELISQCRMLQLAVRSLCMTTSSAPSSAVSPVAPSVSAAAPPPPTSTNSANNTYATLLGLPVTKKH